MIFYPISTKRQIDYFPICQIFYLIKLSDTRYIPLKLTSYSIKPSTCIQYVLDGIYIPSDTNIRYNIHVFICRVLVIPETELSKESQVLISSAEKIPNILSDTTSSDSDDQSFKVVQSRKTRRQQRWATLN